MAILGRFNFFYRGEFKDPSVNRYINFPFQMQCGLEGMMNLVTKRNQLMEKVETCFLLSAAFGST